MAKQSKSPSFADSQAAGSATDLLQEMFQDFHRNRRQIYMLNFVRGIFFGVGSAIGGTLIIALSVWILSLFSGTWFEPLIQSIKQALNGS